MRCVVRLSPIVAIANIMQRYIIAVDFGPRRFGNVRLPRAVVAWFQGDSPPRENDQESAKNDEKFSRSSTNEKKREQNEDGESNCAEQAKARDRKIKVERAGCPENAKRKNQPCRRPKDESNRAQLLQRAGTQTVADCKMPRFQFLFEPR